MKSPPLHLSIIIPTYKRALLLRKALSSLLVPSRLSIEILVIDDSPEGEGESAVREIGNPCIRYSRWPSPTGGRPAFLRNEAARNSNGVVLLFLDDDDEVIMPELEDAYSKLERSEAGVLVSVPEPFGDASQKVREETAYFRKGRAWLERKPRPADLSAQLIFSDAVVVCSSCLIKRSTYEAIGGFDENLALSEDIDFYARAIMLSGYVFHSASFARRRVGHASLIADPEMSVLRDCYTRMRRAFRQRHGMPLYLKYRIKHKLSLLESALK